MIRKPLALLMVAFVLFSSLASSSKADTFRYATQTGTVTQDSVNFMSVYINASTYIPDGLFAAPQVSGNISISGYTGMLGLNLGASIKSVSYGWTVVKGKTVQQSVVVSNAFAYRNLNNNNVKTQAFMQITINKFGRGTISFQVLDVVTKATLAATCSDTGEIIPLGLASGSTTIIF